MKSESAAQTGIVARDESRLALKANRVALSRSQMSWPLALMVAGIGAAAVLALLMFGRHLSVSTVVVVAIAAALAWAYRVVTRPRRR